MTELISALKQFGPHVVLTGMFLFYLVRRDGKTENAASTASPGASGAEKHDCSEVHEAVIELARANGRVVEILDRQTSLIERCSDKHDETRVALARLETKLDGRRLN